MNEVYPIGQLVTLKGDGRMVIIVGYDPINDAYDCSTVTGLPVGERIRVAADRIVYLPEPWAMARQWRTGETITPSSSAPEVMLAVLEITPPDFLENDDHCTDNQLP